jgi:hypothetical protein
MNLMTETQIHSLDFFVVKDEKGIAELPKWLKRRVYTGWRDTLKDKNGRPMVGLKEGDDRRGLILCVAQELLPRVVELVQAHQGLDAAVNKGL